MNRADACGSGSRKTGTFGAASGGEPSARSESMVQGHCPSHRCFIRKKTYPSHETQKNKKMEACRAEKLQPSIRGIQAECQGEDQIEKNVPDELRWEMIRYSVKEL